MWWEQWERTLSQCDMIEPGDRPPIGENPWVTGSGFSRVRVRVTKNKPMGDPCSSLEVPRVPNRGRRTQMYAGMGFGGYEYG